MSWASKFSKPYRVDHGKKFRLKDFDPASTAHIRSKLHAQELLAKGILEMAELQDKLYAQDCWAVLLIFQAMDAAGKDGAIKHVMSGVNPQGCQVFSFKAPSPEELNHDFLWRTTKCLPERGHIGIFNRSYYEEVLVARARPELLRHQNLPPELVTKAIWSERFESIRAFERHLAHNGTMVLKFHLYISRDEQRRRLLARLDEPAKRWKFSVSDVDDRKLWDKYMDAYEDAIRNTATPAAPWHIVPADQKWFAWLMVEAAIVDAMERLDLKFPVVKGKALTELEKVRRRLARDRQV